jgi:hypothetical protein
MPAGYPIMMIMALFPPLFMGVMDGLLEAHAATAWGGDEAAGGAAAAGEAAGEAAAGRREKGE